MGTMPCARSFGDILDAAREPVEPGAACEQARGAQRHVAAADQQNPDHARVLRVRAWRRTVERVVAMPHQITIKPSEHSFPCADGETVLAGGDARGPDAALRLPQRRLRHVQGQDPRRHVDYGPHQPSTLTDDEKRAGSRCSAARSR